VAGSKRSPLYHLKAPFPAQGWRSFIFTAFVFFAKTVAAQDVFTRSDSLKGALNPDRTCFDVVYYRLHVTPDIKNKTIKGTNTIRFITRDQTRKIQLDLASQFRIKTVLWENVKLRIERDGDIFFVLFPRLLLQGEDVMLEVSWEGSPREAVKPPWDGGFIWTQDQKGQPWVSTAVQNLGASSWWPCKDHPSDEPDSMDILITVPESLMAVSNGWPAVSFLSGRNQRTYIYTVSYPINLYNVCLNVGDYKDITSHHTQSNGRLLHLHYYPLRYNEQKALNHFDAEVKPMLSCFEKYFGPYPFKRDGFALIEAPFAGMEHQSAIAYGNQYKKGYLGKDYSGVGLDFDFIIVHEGGHEWWGNAVSGSDRADLWIHEGFCTYAEVLYVECRYGSSKALEYINAKKRLVLNDKPILPPKGVNAMGSHDMYPKAALMLHTLRTATANDSLFLSTLRAIVDSFKYKTVDTETLLAFMQEHLGWNIKPVCYQYLRHTAIPELIVKPTEVSGQQGLLLRWIANEPEFSLPVYWRIAGEPTWQKVQVTSDSEVLLTVPQGVDRKKIQWDTTGLYIKVTEVDR
jgi:aminopeptidase N